MLKHKKCFVYYATESYFDTAKKSIESVRKYTNLPIYLYLLNSDLKLDIENTITINWNCNINFDEEMYEVLENKNFYINRKNKNIYNILIQRPLIVKDCLKNYSEQVCYIDCDSIATPYIENIFNYFNGEVNYPYFVQGLYEYLNFYERGGLPIDDIQSNTLEYPLCGLLNTDQKNRKFYSQTGYFISNQNCINFLNEWYDTCVKKEILENPEYYAPYHEETVANVLLWKYNYQESLPYIYVNGSIERVYEIYNKIKFNGYNNLVSDLYKIPKDKETLLFFHGEKRIDVMEEMIKSIEKNYKMKILFVAPHLSTGGMPSFLLKRIEELLKHNNDIEIFVVEYSYYGPAYVVHRNKIIDLIGEDHFFELGADKDNLVNIINDNNIDIVHFDENVEMLNDKLSKNAISQLFDNNRNYRIVETCHNIWFDGNNSKIYHPDGYIFCTPWHEHNTFSKLPSQKITSQFPIKNKIPTIQEKKESKKILGFEEDKIHVINVGLWTRGKNQGELVEVANKMKDKNIVFHFIGNQAPNFSDYWEPIMSDIPSNVRVWGERDDVDDFLKASDIMSFNSTLECNPLVLREAISYGLKIIARPLSQYMGIYDDYIFPIETNDTNILVNLLNKVIESDNKYQNYNYENEKFSKEHINFYNKILLEKPIMQNLEKSNIQIIKHFVENPFIEIKGDSESEYLIKYFDENNILSYQSTLKTNHWSKLNRQYYTKWRTEVYEDGNLILNEVLDLKDKRVYISFESKSLGDTLSWIPYVEEFRKKHECKVILSTFLNELLRDQYPDIEFINPNITVNNLYALYRIGWFYTEEGKYDTNRHPYDPKSQPLQKTASDILGLEYEEIKPKIKRPYLPKKKKVGIGIHGTAQAKYWNNENGWQEVVNYLKLKGYEVVIYSKENDGYMGNKHPYGATKFKEGSLTNLIKDMSTCEFFIGIGSGLSWLAWSIDLPVILISGFSQKWTETKSDTYRVINKNVCHGCFNMCRLNASDWNWCPMLKDTDRMFECTKSIKSEMVIEQINKLIQTQNISVL
jgi:autotransporter strand-loop-strand O-heptosyltransferase